jgi:glycerophosphoryl diester phosphodiesterase
LFLMRASLRTDFFDLPRPRVIAHRGFSGEFPENTLPAFRAAGAIGAPYLELDIRLTRDGEVVVIHDADLRRTAGIERLVAEMDSTAVLAADAGRNFSRDGVNFPFRDKAIRVPTLREVLQACPAQRVIIEIKPKTPDIVRPTLRIVEECGMSRRVLIASEHHTPLDAVRALAPALPTNLSSHEVGLFVMSLAPGANPCTPAGDALQIPPEHLSWQLVTPASVAEAHRLGLEVHVWTVDEIPAMRALLALGVDGIITNYPSRLLEVLRTAQGS